MKLIKKQISGITNFYIDNLSIALDTAKRYSINLWSEGTQKQGALSKTLYFDDTLEEWRMRDHNCENKNKSLDFSVVIEENTLKSLETLKAYGVDNGGIAIFNEVYFELNEIGSGGEQAKAIEIVESDYDPTKISENYLTYFTQGINNGPFFKVGQVAIQMLKSGDHYDGEITSVSESNGTLVFKRHNQPDLIYNPFNKLPVGLVLLSTDGNFDPNVELGGVWLLLPNGEYFKSCDNVLTIPGIYFKASFPPVYGSGVWERNGKFGSDTSIVDGGFRIIGNYAMNGPSSQSGTTCPIVAFDAAWNTNYANNPYREHGTMGETGLVDVDHYTVMVWEKQANLEAKQAKVMSILSSWANELEILQTKTIKNKQVAIDELNRKIEVFKKLNKVE